MTIQIYDQQNNRLSTEARSIAPDNGMKYIFEKSAFRFGCLLTRWHTRFGVNVRALLFAC